MEKSYQLTPVKARELLDDFIEIRTNEGFAQDFAKFICSWGNPVEDWMYEPIERTIELEPWRRHVAHVFWIYTLIDLLDARPSKLRHFCQIDGQMIYVTPTDLDLRLLVQTKCPPVHQGFSTEPNDFNNCREQLFLEQQLTPKSWNDKYLKSPVEQRSELSFEEVFSTDLSFKKRQSKSEMWRIGLDKSYDYSVTGYEMMDYELTSQPWSIRIVKAFVANQINQWNKNIGYYLDNNLQVRLKINSPFEAITLALQNYTQGIISTRPCGNTECPRFIVIREEFSSGRKTYNNKKFHSEACRKANSRKVKKIVEANKIKGELDAQK